MSDATTSETENHDQPVVRLQFLLKSGNSFVIDGVTDWEMDLSENKLARIRLVQRADAQFTRLVVESLVLNQVEAVLTLPSS
jgi:hypothetical protein